MKLIACLALVASLAPQDFPKPQKEHEWLKQLDGKWDIAGKFFGDPAQPPTEFKGTDISKLDFDGFWLRTHVEADFLGKKFEGRGFTGYSPAKKKYVGTWVDNMMPHLFVMEGTLDEAGKALTMTGEGLDPATGKSAKEKWVIEIKGAESHVMTFYTTNAEGKEQKTGELVYTKEKKKEKKKE